MGLVSRSARRITGRRHKLKPNFGLFGAPTYYVEVPPEVSGLQALDCDSTLETSRGSCLQGSREGKRVLNGESPKVIRTLTALKQARPPLRGAEGALELLEAAAG